MGIVQREALRSTIYTYLGVLIGYFNKIFLFVHLLKEDQIGLLNLILAVGVLFSKVGNLGAFEGTVRFFPIVRNQKKNHYGFFAYQLGFVLIGGSALSLVLVIFQAPIKLYYSENSPLFADYFFWIIPVGLCLLVYTFFENFLKANLKTVVPTFVFDIAFRLVTTVLLITYALEVISFDGLVVLYCLSFTIPVVFLYLYMKYLKIWQVSFKQISLKQKLKRVMLNYSAFVYLKSFGNSVLFALDALMIAGMLGLEAVGIYTIIVYLTTPLLTPYTAISKVSAPLVPIHLKERNFEALSLLYKRVSSMALIIGLYLFICVWGNRIELIQFLPEQFEQGMYVFLIIMIGKLWDMYMGLNGSILIASRYFRMDLLFTMLLIGIAFTLNLFLIRSHGIIGAAIATSVSLVLLNIIRGIYIWSKFKFHPFKYSNLIVILIGTGCILFLELVPLAIENVFVAILVKSAAITSVFFGLILLLKLEPVLNEYLRNMWHKVFRNQ